MNILKSISSKAFSLSLFLWVFAPLVSGSLRAASPHPFSQDTCYVFRFKPASDIFFVPYQDNEAELQRLAATLRECTSPLREGQMYISVSSYSASPGVGGASAQRMAYLRCSRVKSELIVKYGITEQMFVTDRLIPSPYRDSLRDVVVVVVPAAVAKVAVLAGEEAAARVETYLEKAYGYPSAARLAREQQERDSLALLQQERERQAAAAREHDRREQQHRAADRAEAEMNRRLAERERLRADSIRRAGQPSSISSSLSLHFNLLRWATLTPDLGIEYRIPRSRLGILAGGSWTSWSRDNRNRRYALWRVSPELRYYLGKRQRGYLGAMYHLGEFNYKLSDTGKQGDYRGGGITGGYRLTLNRTLSLDFHAALGYTRADYDKYTVTDGVRIRRGSEVKNYWGVNRLGVMLVWRAFK